MRKSFVAIAMTVAATVALAQSADFSSRDYERANQDEARAAKLAAEQSETSAKAAAAGAKREQLSLCADSRPALLYAAQERVIGEVEALAELKERQAQERRYAQASGVRNLLAERSQGEWGVDLRDSLAGDWSEYKRLGGKAVSAQRVTHQVSDPCAALRQ